MVFAGSIAFSTHVACIVFAGSVPDMAGTVTAVVGVAVVAAKVDSVGRVVEVAAAFLPQDVSKKAAPITNINVRIVFVSRVNFIAQFLPG